MGLVRLTRRRRMLFSVAMISIVAGISVQAVYSTLSVSNVEYGAPVVLVRGLNEGEVDGVAQGLVFYTNYTESGEVQLLTVNVTNFSTTVIASFPPDSYLGAGLTGEVVFDGSSNLYYAVEFSNTTQLIVRQLWDFGAFAPPQVIYKDNPCSAPAYSPALGVGSCSSGIYSMAVSPGGVVYFAENFPITGTPVGNGTSEVKEISPGASHATTLVSDTGNNTIQEIAFATKSLYFTYVTSTTTQLEKINLESDTYSAVASFQNVPEEDSYCANCTQVNIAASPPVGGTVKTLYFFYRLSRGPIDPSGVASSFTPTPAEAVVGKVATSISSCNANAPTFGVPCGVKSESLPSPESFLIYGGQGNLQVDSSGDVFEIVLPYSTPGLDASGAAVLQWYNPTTGRFTELASEDFASQYAPPYNLLYFTVDGSGNVYWLTSTGALMEIPRI